MTQTAPPLFLGLDLGQAQDYTALAVVERTGRPGRPRAHAVRHLKRWPLGTPYPEIVADVAALAVQLDRLRGPRRVEVLDGVDFPSAVGTLAVDATGVGRSVVDLLRAAATRYQIVAVTITAGHAPTAAPGGVHLPKKELVSVLQVLLQTRRLKVAEALPEAATLARELTSFQTKVTLAGNETFGAWREGAHDDLVLAVAMAAWFSEHEPALGLEELDDPDWDVERDDRSDDSSKNSVRKILDKLGIGLNGDW